MHHCFAPLLALLLMALASSSAVLAAVTGKDSKTVNNGNEKFAGSLKRSTRRHHCYHPMVGRTEWSRKKCVTRTPGST